jgi:hypothetical protein
VRAAIVSLALLSMGVSCGASEQLRVAYAAEVALCIANERAIVDREGTTREQDLADLAAERARCDAALEAVSR